MFSNNFSCSVPPVVLLNENSCWFHYLQMHFVMGVKFIHLFLLGNWAWRFVALLRLGFTIEVYESLNFLLLTFFHLFLLILLLSLLFQLLFPFKLNLLLINPCQLKFTFLPKHLQNHLLFIILLPIYKIFLKSLLFLSRSSFWLFFHLLITPW